MKLKNFPAGLAAILALSVVLTVCGKDIKKIVGSNTGTTDGNNGGITGLPAVSWGVMKKGSVIVNGVIFDTGVAQITHDNSPASDALLQDGMNVKVRGKLNSDGVTGAAEKVRSDSEVRGTITATGVDSITVLGQQAFVDGRTVFANIGSLPSPTTGQVVEIHGIRDPQNRLLATRIEILKAGSGPPGDRLKGVVEAPFTGGNPPALTFTLRGLTIVTTQGTLIQPDGATINSGDSVAVHGFPSGTTFTAGRIDREDLESAEFEPQESEEFKIEGFVSSFTTVTAGFSVGAISTRVTASTRFVGGVAADLLNNVRVEAEGQLSGGALAADTIKFGETDFIVANADAAGSANVLGKTVVTTSLTDLSGLTGGVAGIALGQGLQIRGFANSDGTVTATIIQGLKKPVDGTKIVIQGVIEAFSASAHTVTILGIVIDASGATAGANDQVITLEQFFAKLTVNHTIVKATGTFLGGTPPKLAASGIETD